MPSKTSKKPGKTMRLRAARAFSEGRELYVPARNVVKRSKVRIVRELYSVKMGCYVPTESGIEYDHYVLLDVRRNVKSFFAQPEKLVFESADCNVITYFPDVRVEYRDGKVEMHEVKPDDVADEPEMKARHTAIAVEYGRREIQYIVIRESAVRREPALSNAKLMRRYRVRSVAARNAELVCHAISDGVDTLSGLVGLLAQGGEGQADILALALRGQIEIDWETCPIGPGSRLANVRKDRH